MKKIFGFTLAEVLITLVIIGVIAALTIPNLMQKYTEQTTIKKVQKFYSTLSNAYALAKKESGPANEWGLTGNNSESAEKVYEILFKPYFKIAKDCKFDNTAKCVADKAYKCLDGTNWSNMRTASTFYKVLLEDGALVFWRTTEATEGADIYMDYDINGKKEPNTWGIDLFEFTFRNGKVFPSGIQSGEYSWRPFNAHCNRTTQWSGTGCAAWVIYKGNMDYLHCDGLTWNSRSCKDK